MDILKIGLLVPRSRQCPELSFRFVEGIKAGLNGIPQTSYNFFIEDIGIEANKNTVMDKCQKLLLQYQTDLVIAFVGNQVVPELSSLFHSLQKFLILTNMGENNIVHPGSPFVFDHQMGLWDACWEMGYWLAQSDKKRMIVASSFYDSGYGLFKAFSDGLLAGEGDIVKMVFAFDIPTETDIQNVEQAVRELSPDGVYAIYSGDFASGFLKHYFQNQYLKQVPLFGSPFLLPGKESSVAGYEYTLATPFCKDFELHPFYQQGTEIGQIILSSFFSEHNLLSCNDEIFSKMKNIKIESQRGIIEMVPSLQVTVSPVYLVRFLDKGNSAIETLKNRPCEGLIIDRGATLSGFINPYLCV